LIRNAIELENDHECYINEELGEFGYIGAMAFGYKIDIWDE
jgi:hypothetical protein